MQNRIRQDALKRLNYIDGHLKGILGMIEEEQMLGELLALYDLAGR